MKTTGIKDYPSSLKLQLDITIFLSFCILDFTFFSSYFGVKLVIP